MEAIRQPCRACGGTGFLEIWEVTGEKDANGYCIAAHRSEKCGACSGKCYTEYAEFTVEEAQAILKHCGIITGEWAWYPDRMDRQELLCTNCEESAPYNKDGERMMTPYCPHCGAKMNRKDDQRWQQEKIC